MALLVTGCATVTYSSQQPAETVAHCIANGWKKIPNLSVALPVSLARNGDFFFVDVVLVRDLPTGAPFHSMWAKVRPGDPGVASGSTTEYRRNFQITHKKIDQVVKDCQ